MNFLKSITNKFKGSTSDETIVWEGDKESAQVILKAGSEQAGLKVFSGKVQHAYESKFTGQTDTCPRCNQPTELMYGEFVYATEKRSRVMTGPGGYFCTNCPTVIINDAQVAVVAKPRFQYGGVCAIETALGKPDLFETMNGEKSIYILDENKQLAGIASSVHKIEGDDFVFTHFSGRSVFGNRIEEKSSLLNKADAEKRKNKAKAAKKARKANRQ